VPQALRSPDRQRWRGRGSPRTSKHGRQRDDRQRERGRELEDRRRPESRRRLAPGVDAGAAKHRALKAVAVAPPPGRIRPTAFLLSCAAATGNQVRVCSAIRSSSQRQTKLAASATSASTVQYQTRCVSDRHEEKTASRLGSTTYSETPVTRANNPGFA